MGRSTDLKYIEYVFQKKKDFLLKPVIIQGHFAQGHFCSFLIGKKVGIKGGIRLSLAY